LNYQEAIEFLNIAHKFGSKLGLQRIKNLLNLLDRPHEKLKFIHVAGTNGKGSVVAFISNILIQAGYKVGVYTSPHINNFCERIKINHENISRDNIARLVCLVRQKINLLNTMPTEFEIITALSMQYFFENKCDIIILEVGLGGRLDATNIINTNQVAIITALDYDHTEILGENLLDIAREKSGIIKPNCDLIIYPFEKLDASNLIKSQIKNIFLSRCKKLNSRMHELNLAQIKLKNFNLDFQIFDYAELKDLKIKLLSDFQVIHAALAIKAIKILNHKKFYINTRDIYTGILKTKWPGRFEILNQDPIFIIDGAHNPHGVKSLVYNLERYFKNKRVIFLTGILKNKNYDLMLELVNNISQEFITISFSHENSFSAHELASYLLNKNLNKKITACDNIIDAINLALNSCKTNQIICAFGSLYFLHEIINYFNANKI